MIFIAFKKRSSQIWRVSFDFPVLHVQVKTMQLVSPVHSDPETSSLFLHQLEYALHLLLSPVTMQQVSPLRLAYERIHSLLDSANTVVQPAFFVVLHLQRPSLQCSPLSRIRNAFMSGVKTRLHQLFQIHPYLQYENFSQIFRGFDTDLSKDFYQAQFFWARGLQARSLWRRCLWTQQPVMGFVLIRHSAVDHRTVFMGCDS